MAQSALLIIDVQQSFEHRPFWSETELPAFQQALLELIDQCRERGVALVDVFHTADSGPFHPDSGWVKPMTFLRHQADVRITKRVHNALTDSGLHEWLQEQGISRLIIAKKLNYGYTDFMSYSIDFRRRILSIKKHEELSIRETAKRFHIGTTTIVRWTKQIDARPATSRQRKIDKSALERDVEQYPDAYQRERAERFGVCQMAICKALKKLQLTYKKNSASSKSRRRR